MGIPAHDGLGDTTLVGRAEVLDRISALRASAGQGRLGVLVVEGEAGIGKTAVAEAAVRSAGTLSPRWDTPTRLGVTSRSAGAPAAGPRWMSGTDAGTARPSC
ncbi:MAG TPA: ATP-binding protein [Propionibacteriaceae bacterium]|nr:ATP-binding protein [Propionibacteriaceae bacterium]